jgi:RHS repeat-associated protein
VHTDPLGTPRAIVSHLNQVLWRWDGEAFGNSPANEDPDGDSIRLAYNLRFPGQYFDRETNTHYNYFRDYDPNTGRYPTFDPIGLRGGINGYSYVFSNPLRYTDPTGLEVGDWWDFPSNISRARQIAREEIAKRPLAHNDLGDAMRHAEWMRRTTQETNSCTAWLVGTGHEIDGLLSLPPQPLNEMFMDLHNNAVGREAGRSGSSVDASKLWTLPLQTFPYNQYRGGAAK